MSADEPGDIGSGGGGGGTGGSGGDGGDIDDSTLSTFLTDSSSASGIDFQLASGINVGSLVRGVGASIAFAIALGVNTVVDGITTAVTSVIGAGQSFIAGPQGLIATLIEPGVAAIEGAWAFSLNEFGVLAFPVGLVVILATMYVADRGIDRVLEVIG